VDGHTAHAAAASPTIAHGTRPQRKRQRAAWLLQAEWDISPSDDGREPASKRQSSRQSSPDTAATPASSRNTACRPQGSRPLAPAATVDHGLGGRPTRVTAPAAEQPVQLAPLSAADSWPALPAVATSARGRAGRKRLSSTSPDTTSSCDSQDEEQLPLQCQASCHCHGLPQLVC